MHAPKVETFDVPAMTNTDPKGFVRPVDSYRVEPYGLYLARSFRDHPKIEGIESWLLPELGIRVTDWYWRSGHQPAHDRYVDIVDIERDGEVWRTVDNYLDIVVSTGRSSSVVDLDEYVEAVAVGLLSRPTAERALHNSYRALAAITAHRHDVDAWLSGIGMPLSWRRTRDRCS